MTVTSPLSGESTQTSLSCQGCHSAPSAAKLLTGADVVLWQSCYWETRLDPRSFADLGRNFRLADLITIMNGVCGTLSIMTCVRYLALTANVPLPISDEALKTLYFAHLLPILGFGFDALDGKVARWRGGGSMLGQEMDSLADLVSFGVAPSILAFTLGLRTPLDTVALLLFVSCGLARLARFNATVALVPADASGKIKYFEGLPIPSSLFLTSMMAFWVKKGWFAQSKFGSSDVPFGIIRLWGDKGGYGELHLASIIFAVWGATMVSKTLRVSSACLCKSLARLLSMVDT